jgi:hypothetical protein
MWRMPMPLAIASSLMALVDERIAAMPADCRIALELLACSGPVDPDILADLLPAHALEPAEACNFRPRQRLQKLLNLRPLDPSQAVKRR